MLMDEMVDRRVREVHERNGTLGDHQELPPHEDHIDAAMGEEAKEDPKPNQSEETISNNQEVKALLTRSLDNLR